MLLTILVVSLLLVIVLSFVVFVRMELRQAVNRQNLMQARANARMGAQLAIARLQELAGPDTRVTAPAKIPAGNPPNQQWITAIYDSAAFLQTPGGGLSVNSDYARNLGYMLSLQNPNAFDPAAFFPFDGSGNVLNGFIPLVSTGSINPGIDENNDAIPDGVVAAQQVAIPGTQASSYAWWVGDEGLKAQVTLSDPVLLDTGTMDNREQMITAQRMGVEAVLPEFDAINPTHNEILRRSTRLDDLNLWNGIELGTDAPKDFFHDITAQNLAVPSNTRRGGLMKDLTAVLKEAEARADGLPSGPQFDQLLQFQQDRISRLRSETIAVAAADLSGFPAKDRNSLQAISLRADQANSQFRDRVFPPLTDMELANDFGGVTWENLLAFTTTGKRFPSVLKPTSLDSLEAGISPVLAKFTLSVYFTVEYPKVAMHFIPVVVLWNPYDKPMEIKDANLRMTFASNLIHYPIRFQVSHTNWEAPDLPAFSHIQPKDRLWTPSFRTQDQFENNEGFLQPYVQNFEFSLLNASGDPVIQIPSGQAMMFAMHEHQKLDSNATLNANLKEGLPSDGFYSFYRVATIDKGKLKNDANKRVENTYADAKGGYNQWHSTQIRNQEGAEHYPYPFPLDSSLFVNPADANLLIKTIPPGQEAMAINQNGLDGWDIHQIGVEIGRHNEPTSTLKDMEVRIYAGGTLLTKVKHPSGEVPEIVQKSRAYHEETIVPVYEPIGIPGDNEPFTPATTAFPNWGLSWGLRLPEHSYRITKNLADSSSTSVPVRWLADFNPLAPFQHRDPASRMTGGRNNRGGFRSTPMYVGGFFMGDDRYANLDWTTPDLLHQFIGHAEESPFDYLPDSPPALVLVEFPESTEDLASVAGFMHANPQGKQHPFSDTAEKLGDRFANYNFATPTFPIGNSFAHLLIPPEKATQAFYPDPLIPSPDQTIPYSPNTEPGPSYFSGYDISWIYNELLWDDFLLTPDANPRVQWQPPYHETGSAYASRRDINLSAERFLVSGAFNINSTSVTAWETLLLSTLEVDLGFDDKPETGAAYPRSLSPLHQAFDSANDGYDTLAGYTGYRRLSRTEVRRLAEEVVDLIRVRGPFLSLSDFVNRTLLTETEDPDGFRLAGVLQMAIDRAGLNDAMGNSTDAVSWLDTSDYVGTWDLASSFLGLQPANTVGARGTGASSYLTQADLLARLGAVMRPRSDTFTIRAYGDLGDPSNPTAKAWCEYTVQRWTDYVDPTNAPTDSPEDLTTANLAFGREFQVTSFRWLNEEDL